jgi:hypothetical protein
MTIENLAIDAIKKFKNMSKEEFLSLPPTERGFIGGCIIGNFSAWHPSEAYDLLKQIRPK